MPGDPKELYCGSHKLFRANGEVMPHNETPMVDALRQGNSYHNLEVLVEQPSGRKVWILVNIDPLRSDDGDIVGVINCFQDINDRKLADERQALLINELNHRVKNTLATVQSIAANTFSAAEGDAPKSFERRLLALSRAHDVLTRENWESCDLKDIVDEVIAPLSGNSSGRIQVNGPSVRVSPSLALTMSIAVHELSTNAAKYGALSNVQGHVDLSWSIVGTGDDRKLDFHWAEIGGPEVAPPTKRGFGTRVIERSLSREHDAVVKLQFPAAGVRCDIEAPLA